MKPCITYLVIFVAVVQFGCNTTRNKGFITTSKKSIITLKSISQSHIVYILKNGDTIRFSKQDVSGAIDDQIKNEINKWGYIPSTYLNNLGERLKHLRSDTLIYQNLSAVDNKSLTGNLELWIAKELLLDGKAEISLQAAPTIKVTKLNYIYTKDILGGEQGTFYTIDNKEVYRAIISIGE